MQRGLLFHCWCCTNKVEKPVKLNLCQFQFKKKFICLLGKGIPPPPPILGNVSPVHWGEAVWDTGCKEGGGRRGEGGGRGCRGLESPTKGDSNTCSLPPCPCKEKREKGKEPALMILGTCKCSELESIVAKRLKQTCLLI